MKKCEKLMLKYFSYFNKYIPKLFKIVKLCLIKFVWDLYANKESIMEAAYNEL